MATVVTTTSGRLEGTELEGATAFLGVPYAEAPIGPLRWEAPCPVRSWSGTRAATTLPPAPPQPASGTPGGATLPGLDVDRTDEDCLTVNVWAPPRAAGAPVLVWIPGGAFVTGGAGIPLYDGARLASSRGVVVVTVTYRIGALGFAAVPGRPPNRGLLDQIAALRWIGANATVFGGDPNNITLFGESAGGGSVLHLLATPSAHGLFHRAIVQSGATDYTLDADRAGVTASRFLAAIEHDLSAPVEAILDAQQEALLAGFAEVGPMPFHPFVDGSVVTGRPLVALGNTDVDLLIGTTRDEMRLFLDPGAAALDRDRVIKRTARYLAALGGSDRAASSVVELYDADTHLTAPGDVWSAIQTDGEMRRPAEAMASAHAATTAATFVYRFDQPLAGPLAGLWSCHASDLPYPFGTADRAGWAEVVGPYSHRLSDAMQGAWAAFARDGSPSCDEVGDWPAYDTSRRATMLLAGAGCCASDDPDGTRRRRWAELAPMTGTPMTGT